MCKRLLIIIPSYNRPKLLQSLIEQININQINNYYLSICIVVDNSSYENLDILKKKYPNIIWLEGTGNWWYTKSMNEGFKFAEKYNADLVLTLNDDLEIDRNYLQTIINDFYSLKDENAILGSITLDIDKKNRVFFSGIKKIKWWRYKSIKYHSFLESVDINTLKNIHHSETLPGRGMLIPFKVLRSLDYFDESFKQYGSDVDFCYRAKKKGYNIYISWNAKLFSHIKETNKSSPIVSKSFYAYLKSFINPYSPNYIVTPLKIIFRNTKLYFIPVTLCFLIAGRIKAFFNYAK